MAKARDAFRTISEVSEWLDTPAHVLRFWESKFSQIKPVKRAGGRRYYRPDDMALLAGIKCLLHEQGMTIKGAQKLLREKGVKHVAALSPPIDGQSDVTEKAPENKTIEAAPQVVEATVADAPVAEPVAPVAPSPAMAMPPPTLPATATSTPQPVVETTAAYAPPAPAAPDPGPGILSVLQDVDREILRARSDQIAPLLARLQSVRDRMHGH